MQETQNKIGKRLFKLLNNEVIFGECETVSTNNGNVEIFIKSPYTAINGNIAPLMVLDITEPANGVQIHPMNILYSFPLSEFPNLESVYTEKTTGIITDTKSKIII